MLKFIAKPFIYGNYVWSKSNVLPTIAVRVLCGSTLPASIKVMPSAIMVHMDGLLTTWTNILKHLETSWDFYCVSSIGTCYPFTSNNISGSMEQRTIYAHNSGSIEIAMRTAGEQIMTHQSAFEQLPVLRCVYILHLIRSLLPDSPANRVTFTSVRMQCGAYVFVLVFFPRCYSISQFLDHHPL